MAPRSRNATRRCGGCFRARPAAGGASFGRARGPLPPAGAQPPADYGAGVAQRNASLRRLLAGASSRDAIAPWTQQVAELGAQLVAARCGVLALLGPPFAEHADAFGLPAADLRYDGQPPTVELLES